jgi:ABC-type branched-subunit amino acid transport system substrate-binding protein
VSAISLLLPFGLNHLAPGAGYSSESLREADISLAYYRGFKMGLDSLTALGYNFKLTVFDTRGDKATAHSLAFNPAVRTSDMIVGPVFPDDMKTFTAAYTSSKQPVVSPLSPASPSTYKNPEMVTMIPPLEYHAWAAAKYISDKINPEKIFILRSGFSDENEYILPFKRALDSLGKNNIQVISLTVVHGQLSSLYPELSATDKNVFVIPATDQHFLTVTLRALDSLRATYPVTVFGHPSWINDTYLKTDLLQRLNTHVTSSDHIDFKTPAIVAFMKQYRDTYHGEASPYAIKGFDEAMYLGHQLAGGNQGTLLQDGYSGLHNDFVFKRKPGVGWINTHVSVYKYANFELKKVE